MAIYKCVQTRFHTSNETRLTNANVEHNFLGLQIQNLKPVLNASLNPEIGLTGYDGTFLLKLININRLYHFIGLILVDIHQLLVISFHVVLAIVYSNLLNFLSHQIVWIIRVHHLMHEKELLIINLIKSIWTRGRDFHKTRAFYINL